METFSISIVCFTETSWANTKTFSANVAAMCAPLHVYEKESASDGNNGICFNVKEKKSWNFIWRNFKITQTFLLFLCRHLFPSLSCLLAANDKRKAQGIFSKCFSRRKRKVKTKLRVYKTHSPANGSLCFNQAQIRNGHVKRIDLQCRAKNWKVALSKVLHSLSFSLTLCHSRWSFCDGIPTLTDKRAKTRKQFNSKVVTRTEWFSRVMSWIFIFSSWCCAKLSKKIEIRVKEKMRRAKRFVGFVGWISTTTNDHRLNVNSDNLSIFPYLSVPNKRLAKGSLSCNRDHICCYN